MTATIGERARLDEAPARATDARVSPPVPQLAVVVPTYNERENIVVLADKLAEVLADRYRWEMIVVDDNSPDGTADVIDAAALDGYAMRCVRRIGRRGLSTAVIEGCLATAAPVIIVMDADLQHDETVIPTMLEKLSDPSCDIVVATRYADGGSTGDWDQRRKAGSSAATQMAMLAVRTPVSDPMSGFFGLKRNVFLDVAPKLSGAGFKILLDILASSPRPLQVAEVPYTFRSRLAGESKLNAAVVFDFLGLIVEKRTGGWIPARFVLFAFTGGLGVAVNMIVLYLLLWQGQASFDAAQIGAVLVAMTFNFFVNNRITYGDRRLRGAAALIGLAKFYLVCGTGAVSNVGVANFVFAQGPGWFASGLAGAFVAAVFNFAMSNRYVWRGGP